MRGPTRLNLQQRTGNQADVTASQGGSPFKRNNAQGVGGMNIMPTPSPAPPTMRRSVRGGTSQNQARTAALVGGVAQKVSDAVVNATPAWTGTVDNNADPTSALSMLRRKGASAAGPIVNARAGTVGNGVINK